MVNQLTSLNIKPLTTYSEHSGRRTTITSFEEMLREQKLAEKAQAEASNKAEAAQESETAEGTGGTSDGKVTFKDPSTGANVRYVDVAAKAEETSSASESSKVTDSSSMKKTKYDKYFKEAALKYDVSESLLKAIAKAESNFNAKAVSSAGAMGVMQLMPATAEGLGVDDPYDPKQNIMGGAKCIAAKLKEFDGDVKTALAAYNAGSGAVKRYGGIPSYCKSYVNKVLSYKEAFETASAVG